MKPRNENLSKRTHPLGFRRLAGFTLFVKDFPFFSLPARWEVHVNILRILPVFLGGGSM